MSELELTQISKDIKGILNNIYKNDKLKIITSLCHDIENKYSIYIDDDTKEEYIKKFVGILNKKKQPKCNKIDVDKDFAILGSGGAAISIAYTLAQSHVPSLSIICRDYDKGKHIKFLIKRDFPDVDIYVNNLFIPLFFFAEIRNTDSSILEEDIDRSDLVLTNIL